MGNAKLGALELLNESLVLRAQQPPLSCPRQQDPSHGYRGQILNRVNHSPSAFLHSSSQHQPPPAQGFHTFGFAGVPLAKPLCWLQTRQLSSSLDVPTTSFNTSPHATTCWQTSCPSPLRQGAFEARKIPFSLAPPQRAVPAAGRCQLEVR